MTEIDYIESPYDDIVYCDYEASWVDSWGRDREGSCGNEGEIDCCGRKWCEDHHENHLDDGDDHVEAADQ